LLLSAIENSNSYEAAAHATGSRSRSVLSSGGPHRRRDKSPGGASIGSLPCQVRGGKITPDKNNGVAATAAAKDFDRRMDICGGCVGLDLV